MEEPNELKLERWKGRGGYKGKFLKFLKAADPCQSEQINWIKRIIPKTQAGIKFIEEYIKIERGACNSMKYRGYANISMGAFFEYFYLPPKIYDGDAPTRRGQRVGRGPTWSWGIQDYSVDRGRQYFGKTTKGLEGDWIRVRWDHGESNNYRVDNGYKDVVVVDGRLCQIQRIMRYIKKEFQLCIGE